VKSSMVIRRISIRKNLTATSLESNSVGDALEGHQQINERSVQALTEIELVEEQLTEMALARVQRSLGQMSVQNQLNRRFLMSSDQYSAVGWTLFNPVQYLLTQPSIRELLVRYSYFNFTGVTVEIVVTSLPQQYGVIKVAKMPWFPGTDIVDSSWITDDWFARDPVLLPVTDQASYSVTMPYLYSHPLYPMYADFTLHPDLSNSELGHMWQLAIYPFFDRTDSAVDANITVALYVNFESPQVSAPVEHVFSTSLTTTTTRATTEKVATAQMDTTAGVAGFGTVAAGAFVAFKAATGTAQDVISTTQKAIGLRREFGKMMGSEHEKPASMQQDPYGELSSPGVTSSRSLLYNPIIMTPPQVYGDQARIHGMYDIMRNNPMLYTLQVLPQGTALNLYPSPNPHVQAGVNFHTSYMEYFSQFFKWWRGSMEFSVVMFTSPFISARMKFAFCYGRAADGSTVGDISTVTRTVKGQSTFAVEIPWIRSYSRMPTFDGEGASGIPLIYPILEVTAEKVIGVGDRTPAVVIAVFLRPGEDFAFEDPQLVHSDVVAPVVAQMNTQQFFEVVEVMPGYKKEPAGQWAVSIEDFLSRWSVRGVPTDPLHTFRTIEFSNYAVAKSNWDWLSPLFLFNSGEISYKLRGSSTGNTVMVMPWFEFGSSGADVFNPGSGMAAVDTDLQPIMEVDIPFRAPQDVDWNETMAIPALIPEWVNFPVLNATTQFQWLRMARTTQFYYLLPPPNPKWWPWKQED